MKPRVVIPALAVVLYFAEGFPYGFVSETLNLYLAFTHAKLATIGLVGAVGIIWTIKFLWAPLVDAVGTYRAWIGGALIVLALMIAAIGTVKPATTPFWIALVVLVVASATQDIAIDALAIRITPPELLGIVNSARVGAYRVAMIVAGGGVAILADRIGWSNAITLAGAVPLVILGVVLLFTPGESEARQAHGNPLLGLIEWLKRPSSLAMLAVILLYRLGDNALSSMIRPYWVARGFSATEVGNVTTTLGMICTILGAIAGGAFIARYGVYRSLLVLGIVQMLSNLAYAYVAFTNAGRMALYGSAVIETFCGGLGTAAFLSFLMLICDRDNAATEYAMFSALFAFGRTAAVALSGFIAQDLGFARYYALTAILAIPGLALLPLIRERVLDRSRAVLSGGSIS